MNLLKILKKYRFLLLLTAIGAVLYSFSNYGCNETTSSQSIKIADSTLSTNSETLKSPPYKIVSIPIEDVENTDGQIEDYLRELFPIISDYEIEAIQGSKELSKKLINDTLGIIEFAINVKVPSHYLEPHPKILWELNIPEFQSRIYQLFEGDTILIDVWPNVCGKPSTKTYTGYYEAFRIRNWPSWKDPESDPLEPATPPGPGNPLGLFCVHYDENSLRYFHGTNKNYLLKNEYRALSHGCVRNDNKNIEKMKQFIVNKVVTSSDLSWWSKSKKSMIYNFQEEDKFPVRIIYKTFDISSDSYGDYIIFFKDVYSYADGSGWSKFDEPGLMTFSDTESILAEYKAEHKPNQFTIADDRLIPIIEKLKANHKDYEKYYFEDLLSESGR
jgi:hypothetical protein